MLNPNKGSLEINRLVRAREKAIACGIAIASLAPSTAFAGGGGPAMDPGSVIVDTLLKLGGRLLGLAHRLL